MKIAPLPTDEQSRLESLFKYDILDTEAEKDFDDIVQLASSICETPICTITLIDAHRQWFKSRLGIDVPETSRDPAFCAHAILDDEILVVPDATRDERFHNNPFVTGLPDIRFYAGMPLTMHNGHRLGTLCVIDRQPRKLTAAQTESLRVLGKQVVNLLELRLKIKELNQALATVEEQRSELQKFNDAGKRLLSVIGHDLRSPLASLVTLIDFSEIKGIPADQFQRLLNDIRINTYSAMDFLSELVEWAEDQFAGHEICRTEIVLRELVGGVIHANQATLARKNNHVRNAVPASFIVSADQHALAFMVRNLVLNANKYTEEGKIEISAADTGAHICVTVTDTGNGIEQAQLEKLFDTNARNTTPGTRGEKGSGLGLQLCRAFAQRQGGTLHAESKLGQGSRFSFTLAKPTRNLGAN